MSTLQREITETNCQRLIVSLIIYTYTYNVNFKGKKSLLVTWHNVISFQIKIEEKKIRYSFYPNYLKFKTLTCSKVFREEMSTKCCKIQKEFREMESVYRSLCTMFGENASDLDSQEFFKLIHNFAESYRVRVKNGMRKFTSLI